ncbi:hypothetical protein MR829_09835, partial [Paracoccus versutus]|nr:hypothetical protein [Paracoccus versutus]
GDAVGGNGLGGAANGTTGGAGGAASSTGGYALGGSGMNTSSGNGGDGGQVMSGDGGYAHAGTWGSNNGDDGYVNGYSTASADSILDTSAFNQSIVMGANVLGNTVDMTVVGGDLSSSVIGQDDLG